MVWTGCKTGGKRISIEAVFNSGERLMEAARGLTAF